MKYHSPLGGIIITANATALTGLWFDEQHENRTANFLHNCSEAVNQLPVFCQVVTWLDAYFGGTIPKFTPPLQFEGSEFRKMVWQQLLMIPYGATTTYGAIAKIVAQQRGMRRMAAQAVGGAVGHNAIALIIPCHRVIGVDGSLTGYAGGMERKRKLLELEQDVLRRNS